MRSKELRELRKAFENLQGSFDEVMKSNKAGTKKAARKKVAVKNEDFEDEDIEDDVDDYDFEDDGDEGEAEDGDDSVLETAEAIVDLVESLPEDVEEEVKDELLGAAADEVEDGVPVEEVVENVRRRVFNIRRKVNNARRARVKNARRIKNARRQRLFNAAVAEGLIKAAPKQYQSPISKFKNARKRYAWNDDAADLNNGEGDNYIVGTDTEPIKGAGSTPDDGYPENRDGNFWPETENKDDSINTYNARVRRIINKARAYDALMNGLGCGAAGCKAGQVNLADEREREAYNAGVTQNDRYILHNGRVYAFNEGEDAFVPADTTAGAPAAPAGPEAEGGTTITIPGVVDPEQLEISVGGQAMDVEPEVPAAEAIGGAAADEGLDMPGAAGAPAAPAAPQFNARHRGRVRNNRCRPVYNQKGTQTRVALKATPKKAENNVQETQVNNSVQETGLDIPSTFPSK